MAKGSKPQSRYKLHNAKQKSFDYATTDTYSCPSDVEVERGSFRIKAKHKKIFRDGMNHNENGSNRQNGNKNHKPLKVPY